MNPFGAWTPLFSPSAVLLAGLVAVLSATALLELSRTLAETYKGRWFAGNGRDLFHVGAAGVLAAAGVVAGLPTALAAFVAATAVLVPLLTLDDLPSRRPARVGFLVALLGLAMAPVLLEPRSIVDSCNAMVRALF